MGHPIKLEYSPPNPKPKKSPRQIIAAAIGLAFCLLAGLILLALAIPSQYSDRRISAILALLSVIFLLQAIRLCRQIIRRE